MSEDLSEVEMLKKSFAEVGAINPVVVSNRTGEVVAGKSRRKTGLPWPTRTVDFKNSYEEALYAAHENLCRRALTAKEAQSLVKAIQDAHYETFNRYLTQMEIGDRIGRTQSWFSNMGAWSEKWTHTVKGGMKADEMEQGRKNELMVNSSESEIPYENFNPRQAIEQILEWRKTDDANPTNPNFKEIWERVPKAVQTAFVLGRSDVEVLEKAMDSEPETAPDGPAGEKYVLAVIDKFLSRPGDFVEIAVRLNNAWSEKVWGEFEIHYG